jgi:putative two-component system response regulator
MFVREQFSARAPSDGRLRGGEEDSRGNCSGQRAPPSGSLDAPQRMTANVRERVLFVDDDESVRLLLGHVLEGEGYRCARAATLAEAREQLRASAFDVLLCDVHLPDGSGLDFLEEAIPAHPAMATLVISGLDDVTLGDRALRLGAYGYVVKPFTANDVLIGVLGALAHSRRELSARAAIREASAETIQCLCVAVEARDAGTAAHIDGMAEYCFAIAGELGLSPERCELMHAASPMHDVGKIGVPDRVLLKPGPLTPQERVLMERHAEIGYRILAGSRAELLRTAATIAWTHHERLDGSGYPRGLRGDEVPEEGRIAAVADVFDALTRDRVYRPRFARDDALEMLAGGRGRQFDPDVLDALAATLAG